MIKVLIVDDSEVVCRILSKEISKALDIEVVGTAGDAYMARDKIFSLRPDVITLDLEMPRMNGLTFLGKLMCYHPLPVIVVSSQTPAGSETALRALELGAVEVLGKLDLRSSYGDLSKTLIEKIRAAAAARCPGAKRPTALAPTPALQSPVSFNTAYKVLAVGASTGGTEAIRQLLTGLPANSPGIVIAQHMPELFTAQFAKRLDSDCALEVREAKSGDTVIPGVVLIAPGNRHMALCGKGGCFHVEIKDGPAVHYQRPSVDVLFYSVAACAGPAAVGVLLTGMGSDGARGLLAMRRAGARTFAQDEKSCIVFGMSREAIRLGAVEKVVAISQVSREITDTISRKEPQRPARADLNPV